jgi:type III restriction enzyme
MREAGAAGTVALPDTLEPGARMVVRAVVERLTAKLVHNTESKISIDRREALIA